MIYLMAILTWLLGFITGVFLVIHHYERNYVKDMPKLDTLVSGENPIDYLTHSLWCSKCGVGGVGSSGENAFFIKNGESVCKKHYKKINNSTK